MSCTIKSATKQVDNWSAFANSHLDLNISWKPNIINWTIKMLKGIRMHSVVSPQLYSKAKTRHQPSRLLNSFDNSAFTVLTEKAPWQTHSHSSAQAAEKGAEREKERLPCPSSSSSAPRPWSPQSSPSAASSWRPAETSSRSCLPPPRLRGPWRARGAGPSPFSLGPCRRERAPVSHRWDPLPLWSHAGNVTPLTTKLLQLEQHKAWQTMKWLIMD